MSATTVTLELPVWLYADLQALADEEQLNLVEMLTRLAKQASQHRAWVRGWEELREQIRQDGGLQVGHTKDEVVEQTRKTRQEIFEAEYAHLYR
jgi:hypothetical protein